MFGKHTIMKTLPGSTTTKGQEVQENIEESSGSLFLESLFQRINNHSNSKFRIERPPGSSTLPSRKFNLASQAAQPC
jgi:hypothetical protein